METSDLHKQGQLRGPTETKSVQSSHVSSRAPREATYCMLIQNQTYAVLKFGNLRRVLFVTRKMSTARNHLPVLEVNERCTWKESNVGKVMDGPFSDLHLIRLAQKFGSLYV